MSLLSLINGALNAHRIFGAAAWGQIVVNLCLIVGALIANLYHQETAASILAISFLVGGFLQVLFQIKSLKRVGLSFKFHPFVWSPEIKQILIIMLPAIFGAAIYQLNIFLATILASLLSPGSISWLYYADRVTQLPIGIFTVALGSVLLPTLASMSAQGEQKDFEDSLLASLKFTSFIIIPFSVGIFFFAEEIMQLLFERGAFTALDTKMSALAIKGTAIGLWSVSIVLLLNRALISKKNTVTPMLLGIVSLFFTLTISLATMGQISTNEASSQNLLLLTLGQFQSGLYSFGLKIDLAHAGLALASGCSALFLLPCYMYFSKTNHLISSWLHFLKGTLLSLIVSITIVFVIFMPLKSLIKNEILLLALAGILAISFYLLIHNLVGSDESKATTAALKRLAQKSWSKLNANIPK